MYKRQLLTDANAAYAHAAPFDPYGPRVRWREARKELVAKGWPIHPVRRPLRDNVLTVDWAAVDPAVH